MLVENFRPGTLEKWGLGPEQLWEANPKLVIARVSGYGQTGPYATRAGLRLGRRGDGRHPLHQRLSGRAAAAHPHLARRLARRHVRRRRASSRRSTGATRSAAAAGRSSTSRCMEACFALLESTVPEYDRLEIVRGPGGTGLAGVAPSNIFKSSDDGWMVIAANADGVFRRLCAAMDGPSSADDPNVSRRTSRAERTKRSSRGSSPSGRRRHTAAEIDRLLNDAGVICGPIYTIADIFEDEQFQAREMLVKHDGSRVRRVLRPGDRPEVLRDARRGALVGHLGGGQPQPRRLRRAARPLRRRRSPSLEQEGVL